MPSFAAWVSKDDGFLGIGISVVTLVALQSEVRPGSGRTTRKRELIPREELPTIRPQQRTHRFLSVRGASGLDVLVESQHVVWVVLFLDLHEASIVRPIARADQLVTRIAQLVDVHSMRKGL